MIVAYLSTILKTNKKVYEKLFFHMQTYILKVYILKVYSIHYALR